MLVAAACETSGGGAVIDAVPDVPPTPVIALSSCPTTVATTFTDSPTTFVPKVATIGIGEVIKFEITAEHFVIPNTLKSTDPALMVARGETKCFQFNVAGSYNFLCGVHSFAGTITVQ